MYWHIVQVSDNNKVVEIIRASGGLEKMSDIILWDNVNEQYNKLSDEEIIKIIRNGDKNALDYIINKYKDIVSIKVSKYFIIGAEKDDIIQEGLIGLYKAIRSFDIEKKILLKHLLIYV